MKKRLGLLILLSVGAFFLGNYLATVAVILASSDGASPGFVFNVFSLNRSPWAEWQKAEVLVPLMVPALYLSVRLLSRAERRVLIAACTAFAVTTLFVWVFDAFELAALPSKGIHVTASMVASQMIWRVARLVLTVGIGVLITEWLLAQKALSQPPRMRSLAGFTLIEVLSVVAIIAVVAAILFPIMQRAKSQGQVVSDVSAMRQLYSAVLMYEDDHEAESPGSLLFVYPYVNSTQLFKSSEDHVPRPPGVIDYPADIYVFQSKRRSPFRISFAYAGSYGGPQFTMYQPWSELRANPAVGMLACVMDLPLGHYQWTSNMDRDFTRIWGKFPRIRMDGSFDHGYKIGEAVGGSFYELFRQR